MDISEQAKTKRVGARTHQMDDFLVAEDPDEVGTWHLPVKINGVPNRSLAGAAWAALFSPSGYRGNPYEGPDKPGAQRRLRALYQDEQWEMPTEEMDYPDDPAPSYVPFGITSLSDLMAMKEAGHITQKIINVANMLPQLVTNIMMSEVEDKPGALRNVADEFIGFVEEYLGGEMPDVEMPDGEMPGIESAELAEIDLREEAIFLETSEPDNASLEEVDDNPARRPVLIDLQIIKPGPGNKRNNNYYGAEMLKENSGVFEGVDVFMTDHNENERGEKTKVGRIRDVVRFTDDGAPVGRTVIYDPSLAEKIRNRSLAGELSTLHCSILASGKARKAKIDGVEYNVVDQITEARSVDLVSRAGAGGRALNLVESEAEMDENKEDEIQETDIDIKESAHESDNRCKCSESGHAETSAIEAEKVKAIVESTNLPEISRQRLIEGEYSNVGELADAIKSEIDYVKQLTDSGKPFAQGRSQPVQETKLTVEESEQRSTERYNRIMREVGLEV